MTYEYPSRLWRGEQLRAPPGTEFTDFFPVPKGSGEQTGMLVFNNEIRKGLSPDGCGVWGFSLLWIAEPPGTVNWSR